MTDEHQDRRRINQKRQSRLRDAVMLTVLGCVAAILIVSIVRAKSQERGAVKEIQARQERLAELIEADARVQATRDQVSKDKLLVWDFLRQCRVADDVPALSGGYVFLKHRGADGFTMFLPDGAHRLEISAAWESESQQSSVSYGNETAAEPIGETTWTVPLRGTTGYMFQLSSEYEGGPVEWELSANTSDFHTRKEKVPIDDFAASGWSYSGDDLALFPNQVQSKYGLSELEAAAKDPSPVELFDVKLMGQHLEKPLSISVTARLYSEGPATVSAGDAQSIISRQRPDLLMPYEGGGKYKLRPSGE